MNGAQPSLNEIHFVVLEQPEQVLLFGYGSALTAVAIEQILEGILSDACQSSELFRRAQPNLPHRQSLWAKG